MMSLPLAIQHRLRLWQVCVAAEAILSPASSLLFFASRSPAVAVAGAILVAALAAAVASLIFTTPPDAIRLPPTHSVRMITGLSAWLFGVDWLCFDRTLFGLVAWVVLLYVAIWMATSLVRRGSTPWWAAVLLWQPAALGPLAWPLRPVATVALLGAIALDLAARNRPRLAAP